MLQIGHLCAVIQRGDEGGEWPFHCIEIADGTRDIAVGAEVAFGVIAKLGRFEAAALTPR